MNNELFKLILSPKRYIRGIGNAYNTEEEWYRKGKEDQLEQDQIRLAKVKQHKNDSFRKALEQSRKGEPLDLSEEEFELFSAIQNDGIAKAYQKRLDSRVICLCGSTRFTNEMLIKQWWFTKYGFIVLSWCALPESYFAGEDKTHIGDQEGVKDIVDEVHLRKIDLADEIFVINVNGYIGESTRNEINYAKKLGKPIKYLEEIDG